MQLTRLASDTEIAAFDCGDEDLNGFLLNDAKAFMQKKIVKMATL